MGIAEAEAAPGMPSHGEPMSRTWKELDLPEGRRAELIEGGLFLVALLRSNTPPSSP